MILTLNPGSSSLKFKIFDHDLNLFRFESIKIVDHNDIGSALDSIVSAIGDDIHSIQKIAVRVVMGGKYDQPVLIDDQVREEINRFADLAPLHNPLSLSVIDGIKERLPEKLFYAVSDTSFFSTLPRSSSLYALPLDISEQLKIKRYGFHGISHKYMSQLFDKEQNKRLITLHLGAGCSIAAIEKGNPIDVSLGMTPNEGLIMQTRSGDLDPGVVMLLVKELGYDRTKDIIERQSGLAGLCNNSGEMVSVLKTAGLPVEGYESEINSSVSEEDKNNAVLALDIYVRRIKKYIGAYAALMGGVDTIAFSGLIGWKSAVVRDKILSGLEYMGNYEVAVTEPDEEKAMATEIRDL